MPNLILITVQLPGLGKKSQYFPGFLFYLRLQNRANLLMNPKGMQLRQKNRISNYKVATLNHWKSFFLIPWVGEDHRVW